jgi:hypothetical protein
MIERGCGVGTHSALSYSEKINKTLRSRKFCANVRPSGTLRLGPYVGTVKDYCAFAFAFAFPSKTTCFPHVLCLPCLMLVPVCFKFVPIGIVGFSKKLLIYTGCSSCDTAEMFVKPSRLTRVLLLRLPIIGFRKKS